MKQYLLPLAALLLLQTVFAQEQTVSNKALEHLNLGKEYYAAGIPDIAIEELTKALAIDPELGEAYFYRGYIYDEKGDDDQAIADFTAALRINPNNTEALRSRAYVYSMNEAIRDIIRRL
jgi:tetratricopeptide (TPR) repeat protein